MTDTTTQSETALGRFGQHPDHITDYAVEATCLEAMCADYQMTGRALNDDDSPASLDGLMRRIWRANGFRVGVVPEALEARKIVVACVRQMEPVYVQQ